MRQSDCGKILFVSNHLRGPGGAAGTRSWHQARALSQRWSSVKVVIPAIDPVAATSVTECTYHGLDLERVDVHLVWSIPLDRSRKWRRAVFYALAALGQLVAGLHTRNVICVLAMSVPVTALLSATIISIVKRVPLVVDVRDLPFETAIETGYLRMGTLVRLAMWLESLCLRRARAVVTVSPYFRKVLCARGIQDEKIQVGLIGYDDFPPPPESQVRRKRGELEALFCDGEVRTIVVYCGTFGHVVEVERVLAVAARLVDRRDIGFVFVGSGQRLDHYVALAGQEFLKAVFLGRVPKEEIQVICRASDMCLYAAKEGRMSAAMLGNKVFDYLGAERPIVYSGPEGAVSELLDDLGAALRSGTEDMGGFHENILKLAGDPELRRILGQRAGQFRERGYTARASADALSENIQNILAIG